MQAWKLLRKKSMLMYNQQGKDRTAKASDWQAASDLLGLILPSCFTTFLSCNTEKAVSSTIESFTISEPLNLSIDDSYVTKKIFDRQIMGLSNCEWYDQGT